jgi:two-component system nitrate/nitrite response regulator NarP
MRILFYTKQAILAHGLQRMLEYGSTAGTVPHVIHVKTLQGLISEIEGKQGVDAIAVLDAAAGVDVATIREVNLANPLTKIAVMVDDQLTAPRAYQMIHAGAKSIIRKTAFEPDVVRYLREVDAGKMALDQELSYAMLTARVVKLSGREREICEMISQGACNKDIAAKLNLSDGTVKVYIGCGGSMERKTGLR